MLNQIQITNIDGSTITVDTDEGLAEFIANQLNIDMDEMLQEMFNQRFLTDHATNPDVTHYHDGTTHITKVDGGLIKFDLINF